MATVLQFYIYTSWKKAFKLYIWSVCDIFEIDYTVWA